MLKGVVLYVFDEDFIGSGRALPDLRPELAESVITAHVVVYHEHVLKNRAGAHGVINRPANPQRGRAAS